MTEAEQLFHQIGSSLEESIKGQLFGKTCYKRGKKAFTCFFQESMVFKLSGEVHTEAMQIPGAKLFDPSGKNRPMKAWVQIHFDQSDQWPVFAEYAINELKTGT